METKFTPVLLSGTFLLALAVVSPEAPVIKVVEDPDQPPTFARDIAPIIQNKCMPCHATGGVGPFPLETYEQVKNRAELVRFQAVARTMPPTTAQSESGFFAHNAPLTDEEVVTIQEWYRRDSLAGDLSNEPSTTRPAKIDLSSDVDYVLAPTEPGSVKLEGAQYWQVFAIPLPDIEINLESFEFLPKSVQAVRFATLAIAPEGFDPNSAPYETAGSMDLPAEHLIGTWAPGYPTWKMPEGTTKTLPVGGTLLVQLQIQPLGKRASADFKLGLKKAEKKKASGNWLTLGSEDFLIPAGGSPTFTYTQTLSKDARVAHIIPEARFFAAKMTLAAKLPDGSTRRLFDTLQWDVYWNGNFQFQNPVFLPKGTVLTAEISYNNDDRCVMNEDQPPRDILPGPTIDDEVSRLHIHLIPAD